MYLQIIYLIYMYKQYLALNNFQWLICHKTPTNQPNNQPSNFVAIQKIQIDVN